MQANKIALLPSAPSGTGIGNTSFTPDQSLEMIGTRYGFFLGFLPSFRIENGHFVYSNKRVLEY